MIVGVPKEIKADEYRVALIPVGAEELRTRGHRVLIETGAGEGSGIGDVEYAEHGAEIAEGPDPIFEQADLVVKVKEPMPQEYGLLRRGQTVFTYFHFAASRELTEAMLGAEIVAIAYETLRAADGRLPLLTPMSEIAGKMAIQEGAK
jgi:alanine dehydrogenase